MELGRGYAMARHPLALVIKFIATYSYKINSI